MLARTPQADVRAAYPGTPVFRVEPNTPVALGRGALAFAEPDAPVDDDLRAAVRDQFARVGTVVDVPERLMVVAGALRGVGPAYWALLVEAQVDAAVRRGMPADAGVRRWSRRRWAGRPSCCASATTTRSRLRRAVTSPGGTTARGPRGARARRRPRGLSSAIDAILEA